MNENSPLNEQNEKTPDVQMPDTNPNGAAPADSDNSSCRISNSFCMPCYVRTLAVILLIILAFSLGFTPMKTDNDVWWHLKTGKIIVENGYKLPENDVFAFTSADIPWHNHEWLSQVIFYKVYDWGNERQIGGVRSIILMKSIILVITAILIFQLAYMRTGNLTAAIIATLMMLLMLKRTLHVRPPIFTYLLLALFLLILYNVREKRWNRKWLASFPFIMILWANLHGGFLTGLIAIGSFWTESLAGFISLHFLKKDYFKESREFLIPFTLALFFSFLGSLCTPYGINLYLLTARVMGDADLVRIIPELQSPDFNYTWSFEILIIIMIVGFSFIKKHIFHLAEMMLFVFFFHQAIQHVRHITLSGIVSAGILAMLIYEFIKEINVQTGLKKLAEITLFLIAVIILLWSIFNHREGPSLFQRNMQLANGMEIAPGNYPEEVADFILSNPFHGNMYNQVNYAGYLIWRMSPEKHKVFSDSRFDIFGSKFVWDMMDIESGVDYPMQDQKWRQYDTLLNKYQINFIVITRGSGGNSKLETNPQWKLVYFYIPEYANTTDNGYSIFVRNIPENEELIKACQETFQRLIQARRRPYPEYLLNLVFDGNMTKQ